MKFNFFPFGTNAMLPPYPYLYHSFALCIFQERSTFFAYFLPDRPDPNTYSVCLIYTCTNVFSLDKVISLSTYYYHQHRHNVFFCSDRWWGSELRCSSCSYLKEDLRASSIPNHCKYIFCIQSARYHSSISFVRHDTMVFPRLSFSKVDVGRVYRALDVESWVEFKWNGFVSSHLPM